MRTDNLAQGLASLGRNGDSMMVHMNPEEVLGLQNLAIQNGTSLTINPDTGMPEAFSLGGVFKSLIPTAIGGGLTAMGLSPLAAGLLVGGGTALFTGDPMQGILAGFGGYGGGTLANSIKNFGMSQAAGLSDDAASFGAEALAGTADDLGTKAGLASGLDPTDVMGVGAQKGSFGVDLAATGADDLIGAGQTFGRDALAGTQTFPLQDGIRSGVQGLGNQPGVGLNLSGTTAVQTPTLPTVPQPVGAPPSSIDAFKQGVSAVGQNPMQFAKQNAADLALTGGGALLAGVEESDIYPNMNEPLYVDPDTGMYRNPTTGQLQLSGPNTRSLNLNDPYGYLKTAKTGGQIKGYQQGGITSVTQSQDPHRQEAGYGMSRLDDIAKNASMTRASTMGYANGGMTTAEMNNFGNVMSGDITTPGSLPVTPEGGLKQLQQAAMADDLRERAGDLKDLPVKPGDANNNMAKILGVAISSDPGAFKVTTAMPIQKAEAPSLTASGGEQMAMGGRVGYAAGGIADIMGNKNPTSSIANLTGTPLGNRNPTIPTQLISIGLLKPGGYKAYAEGGMSDLENGRMLNGNGDGVSDDISATIEGEQPAALSDGEFVVPARIVSELGNGSSDSGAKKLYAMIDRIQAARKQTMGTKKQYAKDTNAERYLPA